MSPTQQPVELADLLRDPSQASSVDRARLPGMLAQLSAVQATIAAQLVSPAEGGDTETHEALLTVQEAAERLGVSADWIYRRTTKRQLPFVVRVGGRVRVSSSGLNRFIRNKTVR